MFLQSSFRTFGRCSSECTSLGLPSTGVRLLSAVLHSHLAGRGVRLRHVRGGKERPVVFSDDSYDFNFQVRRWLLLLMLMVLFTLLLLS